jgi:hypothetical protein
MMASFFPPQPKKPQDGSSGPDDDPAAIDASADEDEDQPADSGSKRLWKPSVKELDLYIMIEHLTVLQITDALGKNVAVAMAANKRHEWTEYDKLRYLSILRFFEMLRGGEKQIAASRSISAVLFSGGPSRAKAVRDWAAHFREKGTLPAYKQGCHPTRASLINDEVVQRDCVAFLRALKPDERTPARFCSWFSNEYYVERFGEAHDRS